MVHADEFSGVQCAESQMPSTECESMDYAFSRLGRALTRMNVYERKVHNLHRQLEDSKKCVQSARQWKEEYLETVYRQDRLQECLDRVEELEALLQRREERRRMVDVGVQAGKSGRRRPSCCCCKRREARWPGAALALSSACLLVGSLLGSLWSRGWASVVINIGPKPL